MLDRASRITHAQKDAIGIYDSTAMIAPTIECEYTYTVHLTILASNYSCHLIASIIELYPVLPDFTRIKVPDLFKSLVSVETKSGLYSLIGFILCAVLGSNALFLS